MDLMEKSIDNELASYMGLGSLYRPSELTQRGLVESPAEVEFGKI